MRYNKEIQTRISFKFVLNVRRIRGSCICLNGNKEVSSISCSSGNLHRRWKRKREDRSSRNLSMVTNRTLWIKIFFRVDNSHINAWKTCSWMPHTRVKWLQGLVKVSYLPGIRPNMYRYKNLIALNNERRQETWDTKFLSLSFLFRKGIFRERMDHPG